MLEQACRGHELVARLGGDEFVVLLAGANSDATRTFGARVLAAIGADDRLPTLSLGAALAPRDGLTPEALLGAADAALYRAKQAGRAQLAGTGAPVAA